MNKNILLEIENIKKQMGILNENTNINPIVRYLMSLKFPPNAIEEFVNNEQFYMRWSKDDYKIEIRGSTMVDVILQITPISENCNKLKSLEPLIKKYNPDNPPDRIYGLDKKLNFCWSGGIFKGTKTTSVPFDSMIIELMSKV